MALLDLVRLPSSLTLQNIIMAGKIFEEQVKGDQTMKYFIHNVKYFTKSTALYCSSHELEMGALDFFSSPAEHEKWVSQWRKMRLKW